MRSDNGRAWKSGKSAFLKGKTEADNPHHATSHLHFAWNVGFIDARNQSKEG